MKTISDLDFKLEIADCLKVDLNILEKSPTALAYIEEFKKRNIRIIPTDGNTSYSNPELNCIMLSIQAFQEWTISMFISALYKMIYTEAMTKKEFIEFGGSFYIALKLKQAYDSAVVVEKVLRELGISPELTPEDVVNFGELLGSDRLTAKAYYRRGLEEACKSLPENLNDLPEDWYAV